MKPLFGGFSLRTASLYNRSSAVVAHATSVTG